MAINRNSRSDDFNGFRGVEDIDVAMAQAASGAVSASAQAASETTAVQAAPLPSDSNYAIDLSRTSKLQSGLGQLYLEYQAHLETVAGRNAAQASGANETSDAGGFASVDPTMPVVNGMVLVNVTSRDGDASNLLAQLQGLGLEQGSAFGRVVSGLIPISALPSLGSLAAVAAARPSYAIPMTGSVENQADASMQSDTLRNVSGADGTGINIGVLSDSFDTGPGSYAADQGTGDLPAGITVIQEGPVGSDEGRAMLQLIHDIAPGATLGFATAFLGQAGFANNILALANNGGFDADIIVDDVFYLDEPFFQDGIIAQAVDQVTAQGVLYFSSAGNQASRSYEADYVESGVTVTIPASASPFIAPFTGLTYRMHDFDPGAGVDVWQSVTHNVGGIRYTLQWADHYGSVDGIGASTDLAMIFRSGGNIIAVVDAFNFDPIEIAGFTIGAGNLEVGIGVFEDTPTPTRFKYITTGGAAVTPVVINEFATNSSTSFGHNNARGAFSVAASPWFDTPVFGEPDPLAEYFTSRGGTSIYYDVLGNLLPSPEVRDNVDFTAPDGGNTTFFGQEIPQDPDAFPNFFGTSAAAPNAAALVALLLELNPTATRSDIEQALDTTARDILFTGNGVPTGPGYDRLTGFGLINAPAAAEKLAQILANAAPVIDVTGAGAVYTETAGANSPAGPGVNVVLGVNVSDADDTLIEGAQVAIVGGFQAGDLLDIAGDGSLAINYDSASGILTIQGQATAAKYASVLSTLTFSNAGDDPTNGGIANSRTLSFTVNDGTENSLIDSITVDVVGVNDAPVNANAGADVLNEDQVNVPILGLSVSDPDADPASDNITVQLSVDNGTLNISTSVLGGLAPANILGGNGTSSVIFFGTLNQINNTFLSATGVRFTPSANFNGNVNLTFISSDNGNTGIGGGQFDLDGFTITVNSVNDAPSGINNTIFGLEETPYVFQVGDFPFTDPADGDDLASVIITTLPGTGQLRLNGVGFAAGTEISAADIAAGNLTYVPNGAADSSFTFQVRDDGGTANGGVNLDATPNTLTLNIANNNAPFVDLNGPGFGTAYLDTYVEGGAPVGITNGLGIVTDANSNLGDLIVSLEIEIQNTQAGDQLTIDGTLPAGITASLGIFGGDLRLTLSGAASAADYTTALNQVRYSTTSDDPDPAGFRLITVVASDGDDNSTTRTATILIDEVNDPAVANADTFTVTESGTLTGNVFVDNGNGADSNPDGPLVVETINGSAVDVGQQITLPSGALVTLNADGTLSYDPNGAFNSFTDLSTGAVNLGGTDTFFYSLASGGSAVVTVQVSGERSTDDRLEGNATDNVITDNAGFNDNFFLQQGGNDTANGAAGNDGFYFGTALDGNDSVDGGAGTDSVAIQGNYGALVLGNIVNVENLVILPGSDTRFGDLAGNAYDYNVTTIDSNVGAGGILTVIAANLGFGEDLVFNGSAETNGGFRIFAGHGIDTLQGGAGGDGFFFGQTGNLTAADRVDGNGGIDSLALRGNYSGAAAVAFQDASFVDVEVMVLLSGLTNQFGGIIDPAGFDYDLVLANGNIAAGQRLDIVATGLGAIESARVDARAELDGSVRIFSGAGDDVLFGSAGADFISAGAGADQLIGGGGADTLQGNAGNDQYIYLSASDSTAGAQDVIQGFAAGDKIDLQVIDANGAGAGNAAFTFIGSGAFTNVAGQLRVTASGADSILQGDTNGDGVADLVILVQNWSLVSGDIVL